MSQLPMTIKFPADTRRAYREYFDVTADLVVNNGAEVGTRYINASTGKPSKNYIHNWHYVHTLEEVERIGMKSLVDASELFTCSKGIIWVIHPL